LEEEEIGIPEGVERSKKGQIRQIMEEKAKLNRQLDQFDTSMAFCLEFECDF
jgi:hypothetical protein